MRSCTDRVICGTCEYWTGNRAPVFDKNSVERVDIFDDFGECENSNSRKFEEKRKKDAQCKCHSKWSELI